MSGSINHRKVSGHIEVTGLWGELTTGFTYSCCHCQATWIYQKGSGRLRGWCQRCNGYVCGPTCVECVPIERRLDNIEAGRPELTPLPARVLVPPEIGDLT